MTEVSSTPSCAVVVGTRDRGDKIRPLISSVLASDLADLELVVVDQSEDDATQIVAKEFDDPRLTYIRSNQQGISRARNLAIANTTAPIIAITDDDCIVPPDWVDRMMAPFQADPAVGVVFCSVDPMPEPPSEPGHTPTIAFDRNRTLTSARQSFLDARNGMYLGAGMAIRRAAFDEVGAFDEMLGPGVRFGVGEDSDLAWRFLLGGWSLHLLADIAVTHDGFRNLEEVRALTVRNFYGAGATFAKYLRLGQLSILVLLVDWLVRFGVAGPLRQVLAGQRPNGWRRPQMILLGLLDGLRTPVDRATLLYRLDR